MERRARIHRHALPLMIAAGLVLSGLGDIVPGVPPRFGEQTVYAAGSHSPITLDVAIDCRTWRFGGGIPFDQFGRGDNFLTDGRLFPAGTLGSGAQNNDPNEAGSIGKWTQRGTMNAALAEIVAGTRPAFYATWFFFLDDGSGLVVEGPHPESGPMAVVGGMGRFSGAGGLLVDEIIGSNISGCPNLRVTITLKKEAPK